MQSNDMSELKRLLIDGEELPGLTRVGEVSLERGQLEVPEQGKVRRISNGVTTIPAIEATYKVRRNSETLVFLSRWYDNEEVHEITAVHLDGHGVEFRRELWPDCELVRKAMPEYNAEDPTYAQVNITIVPWDIVNA